jgi:hypothetical protein
LDADNQLWVFITLIPGAKVCAEVQEGVACIYLGVVTLSWTVSIAQQKSIYTTYPDCMLETVIAINSNGPDSEVK